MKRSESDSEIFFKKWHKPLTYEFLQPIQVLYKRGINSSDELSLAALKTKPENLGIDYDPTENIL